MWMVSLWARGRVVSASAKSPSAVAWPPRGPKSVAPRRRLHRGAQKRGQANSSLVRGPTQPQVKPLYQPQNGFFS
jgi:hypothetical protein